MTFNRSVVDRVAGLNSEDFQVLPRGNDAPRQRPVRRKVRMYFIGTKVLRAGKPPVINAGGRMIQLPPIGEYIEVDEHVYRDIDLRLRWFEKNDPAPIPAVTQSGGIASAVKKAYEEAMIATSNLDAEDRFKTIASLDVRSMVGEAVVAKTETSALLAELRRRREAGEISEEELSAILGNESAVESPKSRNKTSNKEGE